MQLPPQDVHYIDRPEVCETYVDSLGLVSCSGQIATIELCVTRPDQPDPTKKSTARRYPACRLVMTPSMLVRLYNRLAETMEAMQKTGLITGGEPPKN